VLAAEEIGGLLTPLFRSLLAVRVSLIGDAEFVVPRHRKLRSNQVI